MLAELKKIRELLTPKPAPPAPPPAKGMRAEFTEFLKQYKVLGLAVAFILGLYLGTLVQALVKDLILPVVGFALGPTGGDLTKLVVGPIYGQSFGIGDFLNALLTFIIVAFVIFLIVKMAKRYKID